MNLTKWIGIPSAVVATLTVLGIFFDVFGTIAWETQRAHAADGRELRSAIAMTAQAATDLEGRLAQSIKEAAESLGGQIKESQDEYRCDKLDVELRELRRVLRANPDDVDAAEDIRRIIERMGPSGLNCARFEV